MKFKNLRRPARAEKIGIDVPPPQKKLKIQTQSVEAPSASDMAEYEQHIAYIQKNYKSNKWSLSSMVSLMEATAVYRQKWILEDNPIVKDVLHNFPCLKEPKVVGILHIIHT